MIPEWLLFVGLFAILVTISLQLRQITRLLLVIALDADYVAAKKVAGLND